MKTALLTLLMALPPALFGAVRGVVIDAQGAPLPHVTVSAFVEESSAQAALRYRSPKPERIPLASVVTDATGRFSLDAAGPFLAVQADAPGYAPAAFQATRDEDLGAVRLIAAPPERGSVSGAGKPLAGATVVYRGSDGAELLLRTDDAGQYSVPRPAGWAVDRWTFAPSFAPVAEHRPLADLAAGAVNLVPGETAKLRVLNAAGTAIAAQAFADGQPAGQAAADGELVLQHLAPGWKTVELRDGQARTFIDRRSVPAEVRLAPGVPLRVSVVDQGRKPVAGAILLLRSGNPQPGDAGERLLADEHGALSIAVVPGAYSVILATPGYESTTLSFHAAKGTPSAKLITATPSARATGTVQAEGRLAIAGAAVSFARETRRRGGFQALRPSVMAWSAPDGRFVVRSIGPREEGRLVASRPGYPSGQTAMLTLSPGESRSGLAIVIPGGNVVSGRVTTKDGAPLAGVTVSSEDAPAGGGRGGFGGRRGGIAGGGRLRSGTEGVRTAADGKFLLRLKAGEYDLLFRREGFATATRRVSVQKNNAAVEVQLAPGVSIDGRVVRDGQGIAGITVALIGEASGVNAVMTGGDGEFRFTDLEPGMKTVAAVSGEQFVRAMQQVEAPATGIRINVPGGSTIHGTAVDAKTSEPVTDFEVTLSTVRSGRGGGMPFPPMSLSVHSSDGAFEVNNVPPGTEELTITAPSYAAKRATLTVEEGKDGTIAVQLDPGSSLTGHVTSSDGSPLEGAMISVSDGAGGGRGGPQGRPAAATDGSGEYTLDSLPPGEQSVDVSHDGYVTEHRTVQLSGTTRLDVTLSSGVEVNGVVVSDSGSPVPGATVTGQTAVRDAGFLNTSTDDSGSFHFSGLPGGYYTFGASKAGLMDGASKEVDITQHAPVRIVLSAGATIHGQISGLTAQELPSATVRARGTDADASAPVDSSGMYRITGAPVGTVQVIASAGAAIGGRKSSDPKSVETSAGSDVQVDIEFHSGTSVSGLVRRGSQPMTGVAVTFRPADSTVSTRASAQTDGNGRYEATGLDDGPYVVAVIDPSTAINFQTTTSVSGATTFDIDVKTAGLSGNVLDSDSGSPISRAMIVLQPADRSTGRGSGATVLSDDSGRYVIAGVTPGSYTVRVQRDGYTAQEMTRDLEEDGGDDLSFRLVKNEGVSVAVIDARNGAALRARLTARDSGGNVVWSGGAGQLQSDGTYQVAVPAGSYSLTAAADGFASRTMAVTAPGPAVQIALSAGGTLLVRSGAAGILSASLQDSAGGLRMLRLQPGTTTVENVAAGSYQLNVLGAGGETVRSVPVVIQEGVSVTVSAN